MDFTREPIIESVITPKEGCKLVVRSSKGVGQEEFFVDSLELVSFGNTFFLRSLERPKSFLVPATDYEVLEVRETRMVLKNVGLDRSIKIGGGREPTKRVAKGETPKEPVAAPETKVEPKRKERRRSYRRRRGREETSAKGKAAPEESHSEEKKSDLPRPGEVPEVPERVGKPLVPSPEELSALLSPPPTLISESIERYKGDESFKDVFYSPKEEGEEGISTEELEGEDVSSGLFVEEQEIAVPTPLEGENWGEEVEAEPEVTEEGAVSSVDDSDTSKDPLSGANKPLSKGNNS